MKIVFDQGTPAPLRRALSGHTVATAFELGWSDLANGDLLQQAEAQFDLLITTDQNLRYQQNLAGRRVAILVTANNQLAGNPPAPSGGADRREHNPCRRISRVTVVGSRIGNRSGDGVY